MITSNEQIKSPIQGPVKSTPAASAKITAPKPARQLATPPTNAVIATKAYEIWIASGQQTGNDQKHWFEAERQLRLL
jgi:hypothetical protein